MITGIALVCVWVLDYPEAREFYLTKLGLELVMDEPMDGGGRWLIVRSPKQPEVPIMLAVPGPPVMDAARAGQVRELIEAGYQSVGALATDDCWATYRELEAKGVEMTEEPSERFYGIDAAFRDPFGNHWRLTQPKGLTDGQD